MHLKLHGAAVHRPSPAGLQKRHRHPTAQQGPTVFAQYVERQARHPHYIAEVKLLSEAREHSHRTLAVSSDEKTETDRIIQEPLGYESESPH